MREVDTARDANPAHRVITDELAQLVRAHVVGLHASVVQQFHGLVEYLLSVEGQTFFAQTTFEYPLRAGVATAEGVPSLDTLSPPEIDLGDLASLEATQELLSDVGLLTL